MAEPRVENVKHNKNSLLFDMSQDEWDRFRTHLDLVDLPARTVLYERGTTLDAVYFLQAGYVSLMIDFADGFQAEAGQVGSEGMVGVPLVHGLRMDIATAVAQARSVALRMQASTFARELAFLPKLEQLLKKYSERLRAQAMQLAACNGHHGLEARLARCLLSIQDRYEAYELPITHELLATLLCAHRPSVSVAAKRLRSLGLIRYSVGFLTILDRHGLERASCECYEILHGLSGGF